MSRNISRRHRVAAGVRGAAGRERAVHPVQLAVVWPCVKERRKVPSVDAARIPVKARSIAPCPQPVGVVDGVGPGAHRAEQGHHLGRGVGAAAVVGRLDAHLGGQFGQAARSARATSGTSPASAIRFGSSKSAETWTVAWENCISQVPS